MTTKVTGTTPALKRTASSSFETPEVGKPVPIHPLKRIRETEVRVEAKGEIEDVRRNELSPRRLDMGQEVILANPDVDDQPLTQVYESEPKEDPLFEEVPETPQDEESTEEGELAQSPAF
jgi:hypothetical protein